MNEKIITTTMEILGKVYPVRCSETEVEALQQAAQYLNQKMVEVQDSGKAINLERIAIISALNITYQYLQLDAQKNSLMNKINQQISNLQDKLDNAINLTMQTDLIYTTE